LIKDENNDQSLELRYIMRFIEKKSFDLCASKIRSMHGDLRKSFEIMSNSIKFKIKDISQRLDEIKDEE
jgi:hypothetical protein